VYIRNVLSINVDQIEKLLKDEKMLTSHQRTVFKLFYRVKRALVEFHLKPKAGSHRDIHLIKQNILNQI
jgi:hypothetical protein